MGAARQDHRTIGGQQKRRGKHRLGWRIGAVRQGLCTGHRVTPLHEQYLADYGFSYNQTLEAARRMDELSAPGAQVGRH